MLIDGETLRRSRARLEVTVPSGVTDRVLDDEGLLENRNSLHSITK